MWTKSNKVSAGKNLALEESSISKSKDVNIPKYLSTKKVSIQFLEHFLSFLKTAAASGVQVLT